MPPESPIQPRTLKGAIVALKPNSKGTYVNPDTPIFIFQYNPETLTRTISSLNSEEASQVEGKKPGTNPIVEQINLSLEFDTADHLERPNQHKDSVQHGLHPTLAALESIMHSQSETENPTPPIILFLWGSNRIIPVSLESLKVAEEAFDPKLNPIRVKIELNMRVRDFSELKKGSTGYAIYASHLDRRRMFTRLYGENKINHELFDQVSRSTRQYLAMEKPQSKKQNEKKAAKRQD